jgi:hypothetical protein
MRRKRVARRTLEEETLFRREFLGDIGRRAVKHLGENYA